MKYNKSEIMKRAWIIKKEKNITFSEALKESWKIAKNPELNKVNKKKSGICNVTIVEDMQVDYKYYSVFYNSGRTRGYTSWNGLHVPAGVINFVNKSMHVTEPIIEDHKRIQTYY